ncbi:corticotropin-releasing factor receptor 1 isoform X5 [Chrysemys picta bellii]|uniref:corticotropin-releasing factor receptor 1 isoform X5 n=1 Tax=Chrysemys picta bellii TaxID=8478 RepID=UPI0032B1641E
MLAPECCGAAGGPPLPRIHQRSPIQHHKQRVQRMPHEWELGSPRQLFPVPGDSRRGEEEQTALPHCCHHKLPGTLRLARGPTPCLCPLHALEEHQVPAEHHPLEPDHGLHPTKCHLVRGAAHHEPGRAGEQCDQLHLLIQHRPNPHDQAPSLDHLGDHAIQESSEGHAGPAAAAGHHLHAVLRESGGRRDLPGRFHLLQLLPGIFPGLLCLRLLLLPEQRGPFRRAEEMAPVAGQALDPRPRGQSHVHPYVADTRQLPQHQAVDGCLSGEEAIAREGSQGLQQSRRYLHCRLSTACGPCTSRTDPQPHKHSRVPAGAGTVRHQRNPSPVSALGDQSSEKLFLILPNPCEARTSLAQDCGSGQYLVALARPTATEDNGPVTLSQGRLRAEQFPE